MAKEKKDSLIRISVRDLVEFVLRSGDLDNRRTPGAKKEAMQAGSRLHRKIQKRMGAGYEPEVSLKGRVREEEFEILVEGRADGILKEPGGWVIDEIKCVYMDVNRLIEPDPLHAVDEFPSNAIHSAYDELQRPLAVTTYPSCSADCIFGKIV